MKKIGFILVLFSFHFTMAAMTGTWRGFGQWLFRSEPPGANCPYMDMTWSEADGKISIDKGTFDCEVVVMYLDKTEWTIKEGLLYDADDKKVGSYDGTNLQVYMPSPNDKTTIDISVKRNGNHYDYQEVWFNTQEKVYTITGRFFSSTAP